VGEIRPVGNDGGSKVLTKASVEKLSKLSVALNLPKISYSQGEKIYRKHLMDKYA